MESVRAASDHDEKGVGAKIMRKLRSRIKSKSGGAVNLPVARGPAEPGARQNPAQAVNKPANRSSGRLPNIRKGGNCISPVNPECGGPASDMSTASSARGSNKWTRGNRKIVPHMVAATSNRSDASSPVGVASAPSSAGSSSSARTESRGNSPASSPRYGGGNNNNDAGSSCASTPCHDNVESFADVPNQQADPAGIFDAMDTRALTSLHTFEVKNTNFVVQTKYRLIKAIGSGAYGQVASCEDSSTGGKVAIKRVGKLYDDLEDAKRVLREVKLLRHFNHPNIVQIKELSSYPLPPHVVSTDPEIFRQGPMRDLYIVQELMQTDLHKVIYSEVPLKEDHIQFMLHQLLQGLDYMHGCNVMHRDLKPANILINANCDLKICDFGLARNIHDVEQQEQPTDLTEYVVTRWYRAPEIMLCCPTYTSAIDVWSVGCIFAEMLERTPLFAGGDFLKQLALIADAVDLSPKEDLEKYVSSKPALDYLAKLPQTAKLPLKQRFAHWTDPNAVDLLERMLCFDPARRITVKEALRHPYLAKWGDDEDELRCAQEFPCRAAKFDIDGDEVLTREQIEANFLREMARN
jgi:serine/threonine protein kinase